MGKMIHCKMCGAEIAKNAKTCPKCGGRNQKPRYLRMWFIVLMIVALAFAVRTVNIAANERKHENAGYGILVLDDGSTTTAKEINAMCDESRVSAENIYIGKTVTVTMEVTNISNRAIEDATSLIRFSFSDYTLGQSDYQNLNNLREGDIIKVTGTIHSIGGGGWYVELNNITALDMVENHA